MSAPETSRTWTCPHGTVFGGSDDFLSGARNAHDEIAGRLAARDRGRSQNDIAYDIVQKAPECEALVEEWFAATTRRLNEGAIARTENSKLHAERERLLGLIERLLRERDGNAAVAEALGEKLNHEHGDYGSYSRAMDECVREDPEAEAVLREYGRLGDRRPGA